MVKISKKKDRFISILADPNNDKGIEEISAELKITVKTLKKWMKEPQVLNEVYNRYLIKAAVRLPKVVNKLLINAEKGDIRAIKQILKQTERFREYDEGHLTVDKALSILDEYFAKK